VDQRVATHRLTITFLHALEFAPGVRETISITATPLSTAAAMRNFRKTKVECLRRRTENTHRPDRD